MYLSAVDAGGAPVLKHLGLEVEPQLGRVLIFHNCLEHAADGAYLPGGW